VLDRFSQGKIGPHQAEGKQTKHKLRLPASVEAKWTLHEERDEEEKRKRNQQVLSLPHPVGGYHALEKGSKMKASTS
jgi:hypothetical protein